MCKILKVSRNGYYNWCAKEDKQEDPFLFESIKTIFQKSHKTYGTRRIKQGLLNLYGWIVSRTRIAKVMKENNLVAKRKGGFKPKTTDSNHNRPVAPNLLQQDFRAFALNEIYVGDITYIKTKEGWLYLAVVIDLYSRSVVGYAIKEHMEASLVCQALSNAHEKRGYFTYNAIFHSDRGSQYASKQFADLLTTLHMRQSMSAKGHCYDNAACESFFATMKTEIPIETKYHSKKEVRISVFEYICFYNTQRLHSYNNYVAPLTVELEWWQKRFKQFA